MSMRIACRCALHVDVWVITTNGETKRLTIGNNDHKLNMKLQDHGKVIFLNSSGLIRPFWNLKAFFFALFSSLLAGRRAFGLWVKTISPFVMLTALTTATS